MQYNQRYEVFTSEFGMESGGSPSAMVTKLWKKPLMDKYENDI